MNTANLHQAIFDRLTNYTALTSVLGTVGVASEVPQPDESEDDTAFPYVTFDFASVRPFDTKTDDGGDVVVRVHLWARTRETKARRAIEDSIYDALHKYDLVITGASTIGVWFEGKTEIDDPDGKTKHSVLSFRVLYDEI
jgi:hypothetical protein